MHTQFVKRLLTGVIWSGLFAMSTPVRSTPITAVSENFNTLGIAQIATLPARWRLDSSSALSIATARKPLSYGAATNVTTRTYTGDLSDSPTSGVYNFGSNETDRAVGWLASGSNFRNGNLYVCYTNTGMESVSHFTLSYDGRKFRHGDNEVGFSLRLFYSTNDVTWSEVSAGWLSWDGGTNAIDAEVLVKQASDILVTQSLEPDGVIYFAWNYCVNEGTTTTFAQGLGIDNVLVLAHPDDPYAPQITCSTAALSGFTTLAGNASEPQTFTFSGSNLTDAVVLTAPAGFEISWNGTAYETELSRTNSGTITTQTVTVRLSATAPVAATISGDLSLGGGGLLNPVTVALSGSVARDRTHLTFCEDFETGAKTSYASNDVTCAKGVWSLDNMLLGSVDNDLKIGAKSIRGYGTLTMLFDKTNGVGEVSLFHGMYGADNPANVSWTLAVSRDNGRTWNAYESAPQSPSTTWCEIVFEQVNIAGPVRIKVVVTGGSNDKRVNFDDLAMSDFIAPTLYVTPDALTPFCARLRAASAAQSFVVSGMNLTNEVHLTTPMGFEISPPDTVAYGDTLTLSHTNGVLAATTLLVRLTGTDLGDFTGAVVVASAGAATASVTVTGTVFSNQPPQIVGLSSVTNIVANQTLRLELLATDADGWVAQLTAASDEVPAAATDWTTHSESNSIHAVWSWTPRQPGSNTVTFVATDNEGCAAAWAVTILVTPEWAIGIVPGRTVYETFDDMADALTATATLPQGWKVEANSMARSVGAFNQAVLTTERNGGNDLASNAPGGLYNFGAGEKDSAVDRAVGFLGTGTMKSGSLQAKVLNVSSDIVSAFSISFDVEKYRMGTNSEPFAITLYTSGDGLNWNAADKAFYVEFPSDAEAGGYNEAPGATVSVCGRLDDLKLWPGEALYLAWGYSVAVGTLTTYAQALGIDNVVIKAHASPGTMLLLR